MKTPAQRKFETEQQREADARDERLADAITWGVISIILISLFYSFIQS